VLHLLYVVPYRSNLGLAFALANQFATTAEYARDSVLAHVLAMKGDETLAQHHERNMAMRGERDIDGGRLFSVC
jgi:hypothetical protein